MSQTVLSLVTRCPCYKPLVLDTASVRNCKYHKLLTSQTDRVRKETVLVVGSTYKSIFAVAVVVGLIQILQFWG